MAIASYSTCIAVYILSVLHEVNHQFAFVSAPVRHSSACHPGTYTCISACGPCMHACMHIYDLLDIDKESPSWNSDFFYTSYI